jgi:hypothetical protein
MSQVYHGRGFTNRDGALARVPCKSFVLYQIGFLQVGSLDVGIQLCRRDRCVAEQFLDNPQARFLPVQVRREAVPERMRMDVFCEPCNRIWKVRIETCCPFVPGNSQPLRRLPIHARRSGTSTLPNRTFRSLYPLPPNSQLRIVEFHVHNFESAQLGNTRARVQANLDHNEVAPACRSLALRWCRIYGIYRSFDQRVDFVSAKEIMQSTRHFDPFYWHPTAKFRLSVATSSIASLRYVIVAPFRY